MLWLFLVLWPLAKSWQKDATTFPLRQLGARQAICLQRSDGLIQIHSRPPRVYSHWLTSPQKFYHASTYSSTSLPEFHNPSLYCFRVRASQARTPQNVTRYQFNRFLRDVNGNNNRHLLVHFSCGTGGKFCSDIFLPKPMRRSRWYFPYDPQPIRQVAKLPPFPCHRRIGLLRAIPISGLGSRTLYGVAPHFYSCELFWGTP